jgi:nicotinamide mononucleotide (NMN) deamidase PncC
VFLGFAIGAEIRTRRLDLQGDRQHIRSAAVYESLLQLKKLLG